MIWLSYDLGMRGDYVGLYEWLDAHDARECGDSVAAIKYTYEGKLDEALLSDLRANVHIDNKTRLYVVFRDEETSNEKGTFLVGKRRASAWTGYAADGETAADEINS